MIYILKMNFLVKLLLENEMSNFTKYKLAEEWLNAAVNILRENFLLHGYIVPDVLISVGFGIKGHKPNSSRHFLGYCHPKCFSESGINEIYISPFLTDPLELIYTISHELVHVLDDCRNGHGYKFKKIAKHIRHPDCGYLSELEKLQTEVLYRSIADDIGHYPRKGVKYEFGFNIPNPYYMDRPVRWV